MRSPRVKNRKGKSHFWSPKEISNSWRGLPACVERRRKTRERERNENRKKSGNQFNLTDRRRFSKDPLFPKKKKKFIIKTYSFMSFSSGDRWESNFIKLKSTLPILILIGLIFSDAQYIFIKLRIGNWYFMLF